MNQAHTFPPDRAGLRNRSRLLRKDCARTLRFAIGPESGLPRAANADQGARAMTKGACRLVQKMDAARQRYRWGLDGSQRRRIPRPETSYGDGRQAARP